jgi:pilus assembly protein CpaE
MDGKAHILVVEDSELTLFKLKAILLRLGYDVTTHLTALAALDWLKSSGITPNLIITDVTMPGMNGYDFIRKVRETPATARIPVMMLTSHTDVSDRVAGLEAGADDYLFKTVSPTELDLRVKALLARTQADEGSFTQLAATMISVFSLRGGVGTTTLSVNLAIAISRLWGGDVGLWDMALSGGHCAFLLNLKPRNTLVSLADWKEDTVENEVVLELVMEHESGVKVMPAPLTAAEAEMVTSQTVDLVLPCLQGHVAHLLIDAGNHFSEPVLSLLERSDKIVVPLAPELASVKSTYDLLQIFDRLNIDPAKVFPVINTTFSAPPLQVKSIESALHRQVAAEIPYDSESVIQSINKGKPVLMAEPKSPISLAITELAQKLTSTQAPTL